MELSIVTTLYRSAECVTPFCDRASSAARAISDDYELILVNDGSPDRSLDVALGLFRSDPRMRIIDLSRNFGQHRAIMTGLAHASGRLVFVLDSDLEEPPELLADLHHEMVASGADVVYGVQPRRKGGWFERWSGAFFYKLFNWVAAENIPENVMCARLMTRRYVDALLAHREREVFLQGLWAITGFQQRPLEAAKASKGSSTYTVAAKIRILVNAITAFSNRPLVAVFYLGAIISTLATVGVVDLVIRRLFWGTLLVGWPSLIVSIWLLGGLTIFSIGVLGIYLSKIFVEVKQRPYTLIRQVYAHGEQIGSIRATAASSGGVLYENRH